MPYDDSSITNRLVSNSLWWLTYDSSENVIETILKCMSNSRNNRLYTCFLFFCIHLSSYLGYHANLYKLGPRFDKGLGNFLYINNKAITPLQFLKINWDDINWNSNFERNIENYFNNNIQLLISFTAPISKGKRLLNKRVKFDNIFWMNI